MDRNIVFFTLAFCVLFFGFSSIQQYSITYFTDLGVQDAGFISLILIYGAFLMSSVFSSFILKKIDLKRMMIISASFYILQGISLLTRNLEFIYLSAVAVGVFAGTLWNSYTCYMIKASKKSEYGKNSGFYSSMRNLFNLLGILLVGLLLNILPLGTIFAILVFVSAFSFVFFFKIRDIKDTVEFSSKRLWETFTDPKLVRLSTIYFSSSLVLGLMLVMIPINIVEVLGKEFLWLIALFYIIPLPLSFVIGILSDRVGRPAIIVFSFLATMASLLALYFAYSLPMFAIGILLLGLSSASISAASTAFVGDMTTKHNLEYFSSLSWFSYNLGVVASLLLSLFTKSRDVYIICMLISIAVLAVIHPYLRNARKRRIKF